MKTLEEIVGDVEEITLRRGTSSAKLCSVTTDSRAVEPDGLFVAVAGQDFDGHDFLEGAVKSGASAVLIDADSDVEWGSLDVAVLEAPDTRRVLGPLGCSFYGNPTREMKIIGITGTNGKTSSAYLLRAIFENAGWTPGVVGTIEYRWPGRRVEAKNTTPDGLVLQRTLRAMADDGVDVAILEVSSHGLENGRVRAVNFDAGIFTNLSRDHVDFHGSLEAYRRAKWRLFDEYLPASTMKGDRRPLALVHIGDDEGQRLVRALSGRDDLEVVSYGLVEDDSGHEAADVRGVGLRLELNALSLTVMEPGAEPYELSVALPGKFNAENMLGAALCARRMGLGVEQIRRGLTEAGGVPGRMERVGGEEGPAVFVDYAHSPDALEKALATLEAVAKGRLWVVFGCGGDRDRGKRGPMGVVATRLADRIIVTSDNPRSEDPETIIDAVVAGIEGEVQSGRETSRLWWRVSDREEAIERAILRAGPEDVILVAGKGHETTQERDGSREEFDDRVVAARALRRRGEEGPWGS